MKFFTLTDLLAVTLVIGFSVGALAADGAKPANIPHSAPHEHGPDAARGALKNFTTADGVVVSLFAAEPMLRNPTDMDIDERGRVWITEGVNYRSTIKSWGVLEPAGDRIVILEDTDGDGVADKQTIFYQGPEINAALGICVLGNKVIVSCSPNIYVFTDTNGDGKADKKEILFSGISGVDHDHGVHAVTFGPDGKLYFNFGNEGKQLKDKDGNPVIDLAGNEVSANGKPYRDGMVFRCNVDGSEVEVLGYNFRNPYEVAVDSFGTLWQSDNDDDGNRSVRINYVMPYGNYGYLDEVTGATWTKWRTNLEDDKPHRHWHQNDPGVVPNLLITGAGAPVGMLVYEGNLLPEIFRGQMIVTDAGARVVRAIITKPDGAGYQAASTNLLSSTDNWFRPSDVCAAPDGSLCVADWNDAGVGGHNMADHEFDTMTGRIYRLAPPGAKAMVPKLDLKTAAGRVKALQSPNLSTRYLAWTALHAAGDNKELLELWKNSADPRMRARALQLSAREKGQTDKYVKLALLDKNPDLRVTGLRIAEEMKREVIPLVKKLANDPSPEVRRECAIALRHNPSPDAPKLWVDLAQQYDGHDRWYLEALGIAADRQENEFFNAWLATVGENWNTPAGRDIVWRSRATRTPELLVKIISDPNTSAKDRLRYFRALDFVAGPERNIAMKDLLLRSSDLSALPDHDAIMIETLDRLKGIDLTDNPALNNALMKAVYSTRGTADFVRLVADFHLEGQNAGLLDVAIKYPRDDAGIDATRMLMTNNNSAFLKHALHDTNSAVKFAEALGNTKDKDAVPWLLPLVTEPRRDAAVARQAVRSLAQTQEGTTQLLQLAQDDKLPNDVKFVATTELNQVRWSDLKKRAAQILPLPQGRDMAALPPLPDLLRMSGDAARGALVFSRSETACISCHRVNNQGADLGPALSEIGAKLGKDALYEAILEPSAGIAFGFEAWHVNLKSGDELYGIIGSETDDEITIKDAKSIPTHVKKQDIASRQQSRISLMPSGLQQTMTTQELVDLVEYLSTLKKASN